MSSRTVLILIVDDEFSILMLLDEVLREEGFNVARAQNGHAALTLALADPPDLIVTDLMMPVMDGRAFAQQLRQHPATATVPILLISAAYTKQPSDLFSAVLPKPFDVDQLLSTISGLLV